VNGPGLWVAVALAPLAGSALLFGGCGSTPSKAQCRTDPDCGAGACMMGTCLPRATGVIAAAEVIPTPDSPTQSAPTELLELALGGDALSLMAERLVIIAGTIADSTTMDYARAGRVMTYVKSLIPGRSDLMLSADVAQVDGSASTSSFQLGVREGLIDTSTTLWVFPTTKAPTQPPVPFATMLTETLALQFPPLASLLGVGGALLGLLDAPQVGYVARATVVDGDWPVSNAATTTAAGRFDLEVAPGAVPDGSSIVIELTPPAPDPNADNGLPSFVSDPVPFSSVVSSTAASFRMPAFGGPSPMTFAVLAGDPQSMRPVQDVTVTVHAAIPSPQGGGQAVYDREKSTTADGQVSLVLLPGTATEPLLYQVTAMPPPGSPYALTCLSQVPVSAAAGSAGDTPTPAPAAIVLGHKVTLKGTILGGDALPASGISVTATRVASIPDCGDASSLGPVSTTTSRSGGYTMLLDPGTYALDLEPAMGAPYPRLSLDGADAVTVTADSTVDFTLPAGQVVEGNVFASDGMEVLAGATVRFFDVLCAPDDCAGDNRIEPLLRAETRSDANGHFRAVLPISPSP
jgi:hypothetical protein